MVSRIVDRRAAHEKGLNMRLAPLAAAAAFGLAATLFLAFTAPRAQQAANGGLPPGDGRDIVAVACSQCHALTAITQLREGETAWRNQVYDMILRGALVTPADIDSVTKYLATNFGPGVPFPGPPPAAVTLPGGPGKDLVAGGCALCHGLDRVAATRREPAEWAGIVRRMVFLGAPLSPDQQKTVVSYLGTRFSGP